MPRSRKIATADRERHQAHEATPRAHGPRRGARRRYGCVPRARPRRAPGGGSPRLRTGARPSRRNRSSPGRSPSELTRAILVGGDSERSDGAIRRGRSIRHDRREAVRHRADGRRVEERRCVLEVAEESVFRAPGDEHAHVRACEPRASGTARARSSAAPCAPVVSSKLKNVWMIGVVAVSRGRLSCSTRRSNGSPRCSSASRDAPSPARRSRRTRDPP